MADPLIIGEEFAMVTRDRVVLVSPSFDDHLGLKTYTTNGAIAGIGVRFAGKRVLRETGKMPVLLASSQFVWRFLS
jgi:hypothetical protein